VAFSSCVAAVSDVLLSALPLTVMLRPQAVRAIGRCAVSLEKAAQRCIAVLLELIQTKVNYVVQEAVIVIKVGCGVQRLQGSGAHQCICV